MRITQHELASIKPYENNPRLNDDAVEAVAASIKEFGFRQPIVVDEHGVIICGHTRYKAAQHLGLEKVPVHVAKDLSPEQVKAYRLADNRTAELAEWDFDQLKIELADLQSADFDLGMLAFDDDELNRAYSMATTMQPLPMGLLTPTLCQNRWMKRSASVARFISLGATA